MDGHKLGSSILTIEAECQRLGGRPVDWKEAIRSAGFVTFRSLWRIGAATEIAALAMWLKFECRTTRYWRPQNSILVDGKFQIGQYVSERIFIIITRRQTGFRRDCGRWPSGDRILWPFCEADCPSSGPKAKSTPFRHTNIKIAY